MRAIPLLFIAMILGVLATAQAAPNVASARPRIAVRASQELADVIALERDFLGRVSLEIVATADASLLTDSEAQDLARELGVDYILTASVQTGEGEGHELLGMDTRPSARATLAYWLQEGTRGHVLKTGTALGFSKHPNFFGTPPPPLASLEAGAVKDAVETLTDFLVNTGDFPRRLTVLAQDGAFVVLESYADVPLEVGASFSVFAPLVIRDESTNTQLRLRAAGPQRGTLTIKQVNLEHVVGELIEGSAIPGDFIQLAEDAAPSRVIVREN